MNLELAWSQNVDQISKLQVDHVSRPCYPDLS